MPAYQTQDTTVALMLITCGVPFWKNSEGKEIPFNHIYSAGILRKMRGPDGAFLYRGTPGPAGRGWTLEEAANDAWQRGLAGAVWYNFERTELCDKLLQSWYDHSESVKKAKENNLPHTAQLNVEPEEAAKICCQLFLNRATFHPAVICKSAVPDLLIEGPVTSEKDGARVTYVGSFKVMSLRATPEIRAHLKV